MIFFIAWRRHRNNNELLESITTKGEMFTCAFELLKVLYSVMVLVAEFARASIIADGTFRPCNLLILQARFRKSLVRRVLHGPPLVDYRVALTRLTSSVINSFFPISGAERCFEFGARHIGLILRRFCSFNTLVYFRVVNL